MGNTIEGFIDNTESNRFIDKTTSIKTIERITFEAQPFAKGYKVRVKIAFNPEDSLHIDQLLEDDPNKNDVLKALEGFKNMIRTTLKGHIIEDV